MIPIGSWNGTGNSSHLAGSAIRQANTINSYMTDRLRTGRTDLSRGNANKSSLGSAPAGADAPMAPANRGRHRRRGRSEIGREVGVDLAAAGDLNQLRGTPFHDGSPLGLSALPAAGQPRFDPAPRHRPGHRPLRNAAHRPNSVARAHRARATLRKRDSPDALTRPPLPSPAPASEPQDRSDRGSSPCSRPRRSRARTRLRCRHMHRLPRGRATGSSSRR